MLGDCVGIMKDGAIACSGTPTEIKAQYGCGYELVLQHAQGSTSPAVLGLVRSHIPEAVHVADHHVHTESSFTLPLASRLEEVEVPGGDGMIHVR